MRGGGNRVVALTWCRGPPCARSWWVVAPSGPHWGGRSGGGGCGKGDGAEGVREGTTGDEGGGGGLNLGRRGGGGWGPGANEGGVGSGRAAGRGEEMSRRGAKPRQMGGWREWPAAGGAGGTHAGDGGGGLELGGAGGGKSGVGVGVLGVVRVGGGSQEGGQ